MRIQLKRSNVLENGKAKAPLDTQVEYGELCVNYNSSDPTIFLKDSSNNIVRLAGDGYNYDDLINKPTIGDGSITIETSAGTTIGTFTVNQTGNTVVTLPETSAKPELDTTPPANPESGQLWWDSDDGRLYIYYTDVDSSQWVPATPEAAGGFAEVAPGKGIMNIEGEGLAIGNDWSNIPALPEV